MTNIDMVANQAEVIISGYAISKCKNGIQVFNLNNGVGAAVFQPDGTLIETNMDDIELVIAKEYLLNGLKYMEE